MGTPAGSGTWVGTLFSLNPSSIYCGLNGAGIAVGVAVGVETRCVGIGICGIGPATAALEPRKKF